MKPLNDLAKVRVAIDEFGFGGDSDRTESGILVELPEAPPYFGFHSFAFEASFASFEANQAIVAYYQQLIGKRVYWKGLSERGMVLKGQSGTFAFVKLTDLIAWSEPDEEATLTLSGEFRA